MTTDLLRDRTPHVCEIVIPIVLTIPVYIEPVVLEVPLTCHSPSQAATPLPESTTELPALEQQKSAELLPIKALWLVVLASASAVFFYVLTSLSLAKFCSGLSCLRTDSLIARLIAPLPAQSGEISDRFRR